MRTIISIFFLSFFSFLSCSENQDETVSRIFNDKKIFIDSLETGGDLLSTASFFYDVQIFPEYGNLKNMQSASEKTEVGIYELRKDVTFLRLFESFHVDLNNLCFTQSQIAVFCKNNSDYLEGFATFFLFKENEHFFIAKVLVKLGRKSVYVHRLEDDYIWKAGRSFRLAVPI